MSRPKKINRIKIKEPRKGEGVEAIQLELKSVNNALKFARQINPAFVPQSPTTIFTEVCEWLVSHSINKNLSAAEIASKNELGEPFHRMKNLVADFMGSTDKTFTTINLYKDAIVYNETKGIYEVDKETAEQLWYGNHTEYLTGDHAVDAYKKIQNVIAAIEELHKICPQCVRNYPHSLPVAFRGIRVNGGTAVPNGQYLKDENQWNRL